MKCKPSIFIDLFSKFLLALSLFVLCQCLFWFFNREHFSNLDVFNLLKYFVYGLRFDLAALTYVNALFIISYLVPVFILRNKKYRFFQKLVFLFFNGLALLIEIFDIAMFPFLQRRSHQGDFSLYKNTNHLLWENLSSHLGLILLFLLLFSLLFIFYKILDQDFKNLKSSPLKYLAKLVVILGTFLLLARGGWQLRPLGPSAAQAYVKQLDHSVIVSNTVLNLIFSFQQNLIHPLSYLPEEEIEKQFSTLKNYHKPNLDNSPTNVVVITLESFGKEYIGHFNKGKGYTPFLDSLLEWGTYVSQYYANGLRSTEGVAALNAGIPSLMHDPFIFSSYQNNTIESLPALLREMDYSTHFFHGSHAGSMEFDRYAKGAGFEKIYDKNDFGDERQYDSTWGIWDEPFFEYTVAELSLSKTPFYAFLFSLTSHHPYRVPLVFEKKHTDIPALYRSILYTDHALQSFFKAAKKTSWYEQTLFIITADHTGQNKVPFYNNLNGKYEIPFLLFHPKDKELNTKRLATLGTQIDLMPTVLDYLNYPDSFFCFGNSLLDTTSSNFHFFMENGLYYLRDTTYLLQFDGQKAMALYDYSTDRFLKENILTRYPKETQRLEKTLKAILQKHHHRMIHNQWRVAKSPNKRRD